MMTPVGTAAGSRRLLAGVVPLVTLAALAALTVGCADTQDIADQTFHPATEGTLTVATALPAPGFWDGADVEHLEGGFEHGIAAGAGRPLRPRRSP